MTLQQFPLLLFAIFEIAIWGMLTKLNMRESMRITSGVLKMYLTRHPYLFLFILYFLGSYKCDGKLLRRHFNTEKSIVRTSFNPTKLVPLIESQYQYKHISDDLKPTCKDLRAVFEQKFANPLQATSDRFAWDPWHIVRGDGAKVIHSPINYLTGFLYSF